MLSQGLTRKDLARLHLGTVIIASVFTGLFVASFALFSYHEHQESIRLAKMEALSNFNKDMAFRSWVAKHGGVYVPATAETPPNPYLSHLPERDLVTPSGRRLTLVNPAYMMRQMAQIYTVQHGVTVHLTSLELLNPVNAPDPWEKKALMAFSAGAKEVEAVTVFDGKPVFRYMQVMKVQEECLKCHGHQGYRVGDVRGGIGVKVPLESYLLAERRSNAFVGGCHLLLWLAGVTGIGAGYRRLKGGIVARGDAAAALASQNQLLEAFFENTQSCNVILDREFNFIRVNSEYAKVCQRDEWEFAGHNHFEFYPHEENEGIFRQVVETKRPYLVYAKPFVFPDHPEWGVTYWDWTLAPIQERAGNVAKLIFTLRDVTAQKRVQESLDERVTLAELSADIGVALAKAAELRSMLQECAEAVVRHLDVAFARIWRFNPSNEMLELEASAGIYTHIDGGHSRVPLGSFKIGMIARERKPHLTNTVVGDPMIHDQEWAKREGMTAFAGYPLILGDKLVGVMAMFSRNPLTDVSLKALGTIADEIAIGIERKLAERELLKLSTAIEQSPVAVLITNTVGEIEFVNPRFSQVTGYSSEEAIGKNPHILKSGETPVETYRELWETISGGRTWRGELLNRKKNGELFLEKATISPVLSSQGVITHFIAIKEDITESRKTEEQLLQAQKMESIGTLTGGIAHDFNNILTAITGFASLLEMKMTAEDPLRANVTQILAAAERAANLTRSLLAFGRKQAMDVRPADLNGIVSAMEKMLLRLIREDIELSFDLTEGELPVMTDVGQMGQVLLNLVANARDAMPEGGNISVATCRKTLDESFVQVHGFGEKGDYALLTLTDDGVGMAAEVRARIFEPFFTTKEVGKGTGLGLSICYGIVKQHGGYINCYSEPGMGTTFRIYLPLTVRIAYAEADSIAPPASRGTETILLAEDDDMVRSFIAGILREFGYSVVEAKDGEEAVNIFVAQRGEIDLCIFDMIMPKKNGWDAFAAVRQLSPTSRALFTSGYAADIRRRSDLVGEWTGFVAKPVAPQELLHKVRELLDRQEQ